eukprot:1411814-Rhodomonas_salina.3
MPVERTLPGGLSRTPFAPSSTQATVNRCKAILYGNKMLEMDLPRSGPWKHAMMKPHAIPAYLGRPPVLNGCGRAEPDIVTHGESDFRTVGRRLAVVRCHGQSGKTGTCAEQAKVPATTTCGGMHICPSATQSGPLRHRKNECIGQP